MAGILPSPYPDWTHNLQILEHPTNLDDWKQSLQTLKQSRNEMTLVLNIILTDVGGQSWDKRKIKDKKTTQDPVYVVRQGVLRVPSLWPWLCKIDEPQVSRDSKGKE